MDNIQKWWHRTLNTLHFNRFAPVSHKDVEGIFYGRKRTFLWLTSTNWTLFLFYFSIYGWHENSIQLFFFVMIPIFFLTYFPFKKYKSKYFLWKRIKDLDHLILNVAPKNLWCSLAYLYLIYLYIFTFCKNEISKMWCTWWKIRKKIIAYKI